MLHRTFSFVLAAAAAAAVLPAGDVYAGASCTDACTNPNGGAPCGEFGLGCNPKTMQCTICTDNFHCQPGGQCIDSMCVGLPCSPTDGGMPDAGQEDSTLPMEDSGTEDVAGGADVEGEDVPEEDAAGADAATPDTSGQDVIGATRDAFVNTGGGAGAGSGGEARDGCACSVTHDASSSPFAALLLLAVLLRKRR